MKERIIHLTVSHTRAVVAVMVIMSLGFASGLINWGAAARYVTQGIKNNSVPAIVKNILWFPFQVYLDKALSAPPGLFRLIIEDDIQAMIPEHLESKKTWRAMERLFGSSEFTIVAYGDSGASVLNEKNLSQTRILSQALEGIPEVDKVRSIATINKIESSEGGFAVSPLLPIDPDTPIDSSCLWHVRAYLAKNPDLKSSFISRDGMYACALVFYKTTGINEKEAARKVVACADSVLKGEKAVIAGTPFMRAVLARSIFSDIITLMPLVILVLFVMLIASFRTPHVIPLVFQVVVLTVFSTLGLMGWFGYRFMLINSTMPVVLLSIACADAIHIITHFFRLSRTGLSPEAAVRATMTDLMQPVFLTSLTTIAGFITLTTSPVTVMVPYGLFLSFGGFWVWVLSVFLLPARLSTYVPPAVRLLRGRNEPVSQSSRFVDTLGNAVCQRPKIVLIASIALVSVSVYGIFRVEIEVNFNNFFPRTNPIRVANEFIDMHFNGVTNICVMAQTSKDNGVKDPAVLGVVRDIAAYIERIPGMGTTMSLPAVIAKMNRTINDDSASYERLPETREQVAQLLELYSMSGDPSDFEKMVNNEYTATLINAPMRSLSTRHISAIIDSIDAYKATHANTALVHLSTTGFAVFIRDFVGLIIRSSLLSIICSIVLVFFISSIAYRSFLWAFFSILPLLCAVVLLFGLMGLFGIELNHVTALMTSLIIGVGVDFAVHFISQARLLLRNGEERETFVRTTIRNVGGPILVNSLTVSAGFSVLLFSNFVPMRFLGALVGISLLSCAFGALTIMAASVHLMRHRIR